MYFVNGNLTDNVWKEKRAAPSEARRRRRACPAAVGGVEILGGDTSVAPCSTDLPCLTRFNFCLSLETTWKLLPPSSKSPICPFLNSSLGRGEQTQLALISHLMGAAVGRLAVSQRSLFCSWIVGIYVMSNETLDL